MALNVCKVDTNSKKGIYKKPYVESKKSTRLKIKIAIKKEKIIPSIPNTEYNTNFHFGIMVMLLFCTASIIFVFNLVIVLIDKEKLVLKVLLFLF